MSGEAPRQIGDGSKQRVRVLTHGKERMAVHEADAIFYLSLVETEPTLGMDRPALFVRSSGGKQQLCMRFSSGVTQILATEP